MSFESGRAETIRYHTELYLENSEPTPGSWLYQPAQYVMSAFEMLDLSADLAILDLGAGNGRHAIPIAQLSSAESRVTALDLLPVAVEQIERRASAAGVSEKIHTVVDDVEHHGYGRQEFDLVISCSCIEHVSTQDAFQRVLEALMETTKPGGYNVFMIATDGREITKSGLEREPLMELNISSDVVNQILTSLYSDWTVVDHSSKAWITGEARDGEEYDMNCTCVQFTANQPA